MGFECLISSTSVATGGWFRPCSGLQMALGVADWARGNYVANCVHLNFSIYEKGIIISWPARPSHAFSFASTVSGLLLGPDDSLYCVDLGISIFGLSCFVQPRYVDRRDVLPYKIYEWLSMCFSLAQPNTRHTRHPQRFRKTILARLGKSH